MIRINAYHEKNAGVLDKIKNNGNERYQIKQLPAFYRTVRDSQPTDNQRQKRTVYERINGIDNAGN